LDLLLKYEIPVAKGEVASSPEEAINVASEIGYPIVLKVISPQITHKTEAKALTLSIISEKKLIECYHEAIDNAKKHNPEAKIEGVLIQEMVPNGTEIIVGISRDPQFGPTILFGLGGIFVEVLKDISLRVPPITRYDAEEMIREIKGYNVLKAFRGKPRSDIEAIVNILLNVSKLSIDLKNSISEMDLNPVIVQAENEGAKAVDFRIVTRI